MTKTELNKKEIEALLPHREPMLLIDKLTKIVHLKSATAIMYVKKMDFMSRAIFLANRSCQECLLSKHLAKLLQL